MFPDFAGDGEVVGVLILKQICVLAVWRFGPERVQAIYEPDYRTKVHNESRLKGIFKPDSQDGGLLDKGGWTDYDSVYQTVRSF